MAHGDAREGKWRGNWRMEWVASTFHTTSEHGVSNITTAAAHTSAASSRLNWPQIRTDAPADLNGLVHFAERRNLVSARVPSHFKCSLHIYRGFRETKTQHRTQDDSKFHNNRKGKVKQSHYSWQYHGRLRLKCDGTRAETRFRLSRETDESM